MNFIQTISNNPYIVIPAVLIWVVAIIIWCIQMYLRFKENKRFNKKIYTSSLLIILAIGICTSIMGILSDSNIEKNKVKQNQEKIINLQFQQTKLQIKMQQHPDKINQYQTQWKHNQTEINQLNHTNTTH